MLMSNPLSDMRFTLLAVKVFSEGGTCRRKLSANTVYPLVKWVNWTSDNNVIILQNGLKRTMVYDRYMSEVNDDRVQVQAIVGENGSGKSSLVEFIIRLINNFAAATLGETMATPQSVPLHYIDGIDGALLYVADGLLYQIKVYKRKTTLYQYTFNEEKYAYEMNYDKILFKSKTSVSGLEPMIRINDQKGLSDLMNKFFFTIVTNYALYAYNPNDYPDEQCSNYYEGRIRNKHKKYELNERHWLTGIFHKNDGYEAPITLTPFREGGNIDVSLEKELAIERLVSSMLIGVEISEMDKNNHRPRFQSFRVLNGHLNAVSISLKEKNIDYNNKLLNKLKVFDRLYGVGFEAMRSVVVECWSKVVGQPLESYSNKKFYEKSINYLTYKTLRISGQYRIYGKFVKENKAMTRKFDEDLLRNLILENLAKDRSHITRKIRQVLTYLVYDIYDFKKKPDEKNGYILYIDEVGKRATTILGTINTDQFIGDIGDFTPPPFMQMNINLEDILTGQEVRFETLSSGEKQQAYSVSGILYHLLNIGSANRTAGEDRVKYRYVNIILEEMELYYHPEMQKNLLMFLLDGIRQTRIHYIEGINILIVTHSPFILSDIVRDNILLLKKKEGVTDDPNLKTFGANIYEMLDTGFFMEKGAIGDFAQWHINEIISRLKKEKPCDAEELLGMIDVIDDPIIKQSLLLKYEDVFNNVDEIDSEIKMLQFHIKELQERRKRNVVSS